MAANKESGGDSHCTPEPQEDLDSQRFYSDRRYESYFDPNVTAEPDSSCPLVTPTVTSSTHEATSIPFKMPQVEFSTGDLPFDRKEARDKKTPFLNPRRVSPSEQCNGSDPFDSPTPTKFSALPNAKALATSDHLVPPSLVSPYIPQRDEFDAENAPTMPALLEVARAAHAKCH